METIVDPVLVTSLQLQRCEVTCADAICGRLAAGGGNGALRLWRWSRGVGWLEFAEQKRAHRYGVTGTRFSASGVLLASIGIDGAARVWAAYEGLSERRTLVAPDAAAARALQWASSERLVVGHDDGAIRIWSVRGGTLLSHVRPHEGAVYALATLAFNALLLSACTDGVLKVFDFQEVVAQGKEGKVGPTPLLWEDGAHDLGALCATECGRDAATGGHDGRIRIWRAIGVGYQRHIEADVTLSGHTAAVTALRWKQDLLTSASLDRTARLWTVSSAVCIRVLHAHSRYLTCIVLATDMRYIITGSNDKTIRTWSLGVFSIDDNLEAECNPLVHFGLGDLEGIGKVDDDIELSSDTVVRASIGTHCISRVSHAAAINCIAASQTHLATASSDGCVRIFRWCGEDDGFALQPEMELSAHTYPALAVDFGANGALLLSAGLDGCARLWDVKTGCELLVLSAENSAWRGDGGGGVRDARSSPHRPPMLLLSSDDGFTALWGIEQTSPDPLQVYPGLVEAALCCSWSSDGGLAAAGGAAGELQVLAPPRPSALCQQADAHDLGVLSCDFAPNLNGNESKSERKMYILATGGRDALIKLWWVTVEVENDNIEQASLKLSRALAAHGGAVQCVRWAQFGRYNYELALATGGADRWARVWRVTINNEDLEALSIMVVPAGAAGGAPAVRLLGNEDKSFLVVGALSGTLALWCLPEDDLQEEIEGAEPRFWSINGVIRWLYEYVTRPSAVPRIVDGDPTTIENYPFMASMLFNLWEPYCGGTLITNTAVVSAAHCYGNNPPSLWKVRLGSSFSLYGGKEHLVSKIIIHENYTARVLLNDVAVIKLIDPAVFSDKINIARIAGPNYILPDNTLVYAIGWGRTQWNGDSSQVLQHVAVNTINHQICTDRYAFLKSLPWISNMPDVTPEMLCTGILNVGGKDACQGDSGGPVIHNRDVLVGIISWGHRCAERFFPGVNARVSSYSDWIYTNSLDV